MLPTTESALLKRLLIRCSQLGARIFRNQIGRYRLALPDCDRCQTHGRVLSSGLCVGSSDLIGWQSVTIEQKHVGQTLAVFVALEVKGPRGRVSTEQAQFLSVVGKAGAVAGVVRSEEDAAMLLAPWL